MQSLIPVFALLYLAALFALAAIVTRHVMPVSIAMSATSIMLTASIALATL